MALMTHYADPEPTRAEVDALLGSALIEFGSPWCGYCRSAQPLVAAALEKRPNVKHLKIEDGRAKPLGRSFGVKLWPTLVFMSGGVERARLVRPHDRSEIEEAIARIELA